MSERLEEIKEQVKYLQGDFLRDDLDWLIKQAERVQELEDIIYQDARQDVIEGLYEENKRYREALKFYADRDNYKLEHFDPNLDDYMSTVDYDEGQKARQTIGSEKIND